MPNGKLAICYAEATAMRFPGKRYKDGFGIIKFWPEELQQIRDLKTPAGIFIDSMSDLFGQNVERAWIDAVIDTMRDCPQHVFFSLTKNPSRFREFTAENKPWPANWLVGISAPPTIMFGKEMTVDQQKAWLKRGLQFLRDCPAYKRWVSLEPLSFDVSGILSETNCPLDWAVLGAASDGAQEYQPSEKNLKLALDALDRRLTKVFFKGNLSRSFVKICGSAWREEFPTIVRQNLTADTKEVAA